MIDMAEPKTKALVQARLKAGVRQVKAVRLVPGWPAMNLMPGQTFWVHPECWSKLYVLVEPPSKPKQIVKTIPVTQAMKTIPATVIPPASVPDAHFSFGVETHLKAETQSEDKHA